MEKVYSVTFGSGDIRVNTGLTPTFLIFQTIGGTALAAPAITEVGSGTGFYAFSYGITAYGFTIAMQCLIDGGSGLSDDDRYVSAVIDSLSAVDRVMGFLGDSIGSTAIDPASAVAYLARNLEWLEGDANYNKAATTWDVYTRGSSTLLREKLLTNSSTAATKT